MTLQEIVAAVNAGKLVRWGNRAYRVVPHTQDVKRWLIVCEINDHAIGLTWVDGETMNGEEKDFFIDEGETE